MDRFKVAAFSFLALTTGLFASVEDQLISTQEIKREQNLPLEDWFDDFSKAKALAEEKGLSILIAFLGPSWCEFSDQLEADVLSSPSFYEQIEPIVRVKVDIPKDWEEGSFPGKALKEAYHVKQCPVFVLVDPSGRPIAKLCNIPLQPDACASIVKKTLGDYYDVALLAEERSVRKLGANELKTLYAKAGRLADTAFKRALLKEGLKVDKTPYFLIEEYGSRLASGELKGRRLSHLRKKIFARDPKNYGGYMRQLALLDFEALATSTKEEKNAGKVIAPLLKYLKNFGSRDLENAWKIEMKISQYLFGRDHLEEAIEHAKASLTLAPGQEHAEVLQSIEYLEKKRDAQQF